MWFLFHKNAKVRAVKGGERFVETCPSCARRATFVEVEIEENVGMFFVDVLGDKQRAYRCAACGDTFDLEERAAPPARTLPPARSAAELAAATKARELAAATKATRVEDELAELKRRLGKKP